MKTRILVVGDYINDMYLPIKDITSGATEHTTTGVSPVYVSNRGCTFPGGAGNVVKNLKSLDPSSEVSIASQQEGYDTKIRYYYEDGNGTPAFRIDNKSKNWKPANIDLSQKYNALVISDYNKGAINVKVLENLTQLRADPWFIHTKRNPDFYKDLADIFVCNFSEYTLYEAQYNKLTKVVITSGNKSTILLERGRIKEIIKPPTIQEQCVVGAGDSFFAELVLQHLYDNDILNSICFANIAGAISASKPFTHSVTNNEIKSFLEKIHTK